MELGLKARGQVGSRRATRAALVGRREMARGNGCGVHGTCLVEHFLPNIICPVRGDWGHEQGLKLDVSKDKIPMHANSSRSGGFTVKVTGAREIV